MIKLLVDCVIFQKDPQGGIARLYREIWPRMCEMEPELKIKLFFDGPTKLNLEKHPQIDIQSAPMIKRRVITGGVLKTILYPFRRTASRAWQLARSFWLGLGSGMIWHSTYYTWPEVWEGHQVVTVHDMIHERFPELYNDPLDEVARRQKRRCVEQANAIICVSETTRKDVERFYGIPTAPIYVIPSALSEMFQPLANDTEPIHNLPNEPFFLYVGKRTHHKNFDNFIEVYSQWDGNDDVCVVVAGLPWTRQEWQHLEQLGIKERIHLVNEVDDQDLCQLYNRAKALVFPSLYEGFGLPVLEAMACGCPVIASYIPTSEYLGEDIPFYFDPTQPQTLFSAFDRALTTGKNSARMRAGMERAGRFTWENTAKGYLEVYRQLDNRHRE